MRLDHAQVEADEQLQGFKNVIGVGTEGWVPLAEYENARKHGRKQKNDALDAAVSGKERVPLKMNWIFDDLYGVDYM